MDSAVDPVVEIEDVQRTYGSFAALSGVDLRVEPGRIHALLGPNGAGKTTLLRIVTGLIEPTEGRVKVMGRDSKEHGMALRKYIGFVPSGDRAFYLRLSAMENLAFFGRMQGLTRSEALRRGTECIKDVGLADAGNRRVGNYSHGMQKRLAVARALMVTPPVLLVDEATHDLDPDGARRIQQLVSDAASRGAGVLWTTQRLEEIRGFADQVTVISHGRARFTGTVPELMARANTRRYLIYVRPRPGAPTDVERWREALGAEADLVGSGLDSEHLILVVSDEAVLGSSIARLDAAGADVLSCSEERSRIEAAFLDLTAADAPDTTSRPPSQSLPSADHPSRVRLQVAADQLTPAPAEPTGPRDRLPPVLTEMRKLPAFGRRDLLIQLSYRTAYLSEVLSLSLQTVVFAFVAKLVDPTKIPVDAGVGNPYLAFVAVGIAVAAFMQLGLSRVVAAIQTEQALGTLDSLLVTPTAFPTIQLGSAMYDAVYVPLRTAIFLTAVSLAFGVRFHASGFLPAAAVLFLFVPVVWGIGVVAAAGVLTFRRGANLIGFAAAASSLTSGAFFPLTLFPRWISAVAKYNPMALTLRLMRDVLINGAGWSSISGGLVALAVSALVSLSLGTVAFRAAVARERRLGTIGLY
ncbi:MAG: ABC transporter ATP-binding protein/permease [Mycobacteriales bacterium]